MTLREMLEGLGRKERERGEAAQRLLAELTALLPKARSHHHVRPYRHVINGDDVVQEVAIKVLLKVDGGEPFIARESDGSIRAYLKCMLVNKWIDLGRKYKDAAELPELPAPAPVTAGDGDEEEDRARGVRVARGHAALERVLAWVRESLAPEHRPNLDQAWAVAQALCRDGVTVDQVLADQEGVIRGTAPEEQRIRARDRVLQAQRRLRERLLGELERRAALGDLSIEDAELGRIVIRTTYFRRQKRAPSSSKGHGGNKPGSGM